ncbi:MAG TPA: hypothetical protein VMS98_04755 [Thermoanaerobaculia bacterium]|nr:hypothetical protein [Thermoanaerobaculia bacterium]
MRCDFSVSIVAAALLIISCRSAVPPAEINPRDVAEMSPDDGVVSATLLEDPDPPEVQLGPNEEFVQPVLRRGNGEPEYPPELIDRRPAPHVVAVRLTFDEWGRLSDTSPSPLVPSTGGEHAPAFEAAVIRAVETWRCLPARIRKFRDGPDSDGDGKADYRIMTDQKPLKTRFDVAFSFEIVNGVPVVKQTR